DPCLNGGRWMGTACLCPPNMDGPRCEFGATTINLTAELGPFVTMMARVTNRDFSEDMGDASSPGHRRFAEEFSRTVRPRCDGMCQLSTPKPPRCPPSRGSVVVNYRVRLQPLPGNASLERRALELLAVTNAASRPHDCGPSAGSERGLGTAGDTTGWGWGTPDRSLASPELCWRHAPANFSRFYFPYRMGNGLLCVTNCTLNVPGAFDCHRG
ncbi:MUC3B protein, partial [Bombycilla garrulus]|nr:MUC3B protein [Bombycilla garrulus]